MWNSCFDSSELELGSKSNKQEQYITLYEEVDTRCTHVCFLLVLDQYCKCHQKQVQLAILLTSGVNLLELVNNPMTDDHHQILLCLFKFKVSQIYKAVIMAVSENDKIVSGIWANGAKVNKDQKTRRIKVKKEKNKNKY